MKGFPRSNYGLATMVKSGVVKLDKSAWSARNLFPGGVLSNRQSWDLFSMNCAIVLAIHPA